MGYGHYLYRWGSGAHGQSKMNALVRLICMILISQLAASALPVQASPLKSGHGTLKLLKPFEDLSTIEDPAEIFGSAVRAYQANNLSEAERLFKKVLKLDPRNAEAVFNLGTLAEKRGDLTLALEHYRVALKLKPTDRDFRAAVNETVAGLKENEQIKKQRTEELKSQQLADMSRQAKAAFAAGSYVEAAQKLKKLEALFPKESNLEFALGQSFRALKAFSWAAYHLRMAIYLDPENDTYRQSLVDLDQEIQAAQEKAFTYSANLVNGHVHPLLGGEVAYNEP